MKTSDCSFLDVPGARLCHESRGSGPLIVMVPGPAGSAELYRVIAAELASRYRVVAYDRRGFSRSALNGDQDYDRRLKTYADDVGALTEHLSSEPAIVLGNSSVAIVSLETLIRHPASARMVIAHEPPTVKELADGEPWADFFTSVYDLYRRSGPAVEMARFRYRSFLPIDREVMAKVPTNDFTEANSRYWFDHKLRQYPSAILDHAALDRYADRVLLADAGYWSEANEKAIAVLPVTDALIVTTKDWRRRTELREQGPPRGRIPTGPGRTERMERRLRTNKGHELHAQRGCTIEPVCGQIKDGRGGRRFMRRGLTAVAAEFTLMAAATTC